MLYYKDFCCVPALVCCKHDDQCSQTEKLVVYIQQALDRPSSLVGYVHSGVGLFFM